MLEEETVRKSTLNNVNGEGHSDNSITLRLSVLFGDIFYNKEKNEDFKRWDQIDLVDDTFSEALILATTRSLCENEPSYYISTDAEKDRNLCYALLAESLMENETSSLTMRSSNNMQMNQQLTQTKLLIDPNHAVSDVTQVTSSIKENNSPLEWVQVGVKFNIVEVNNRVMILSASSLGSVSEYDIVKQQANKKINDDINSGRFMELMKEREYRVRSVSSVGSEEATFSSSSLPPLNPNDWLSLGTNVANTNLNSEEGQSIGEPIFRPEKVDGLRVAGICILLALLAFLGILYSAVKHASKKEETELKEQDQTTVSSSGNNKNKTSKKTEESKDNKNKKMKIALGTDEGVEEMLMEGGRIAEQKLRLLADRAKHKEQISAGPWV